MHEDGTKEKNAKKKAKNIESEAESDTQIQYEARINLNNITQPRKVLIYNSATPDVLRIRWNERTENFEESKSENFGNILNLCREENWIINQGEL